jgi:LemA protein
MKGCLGCGVLTVVVAAAAVTATVWGVLAYTSLVRSEIEVDKAWARIEALSERRLELIPSLLDNVRDISLFERGMIREVAAARARASELVLTPEITDGSESLERFDQLQAELTLVLGRLFRTLDSYPRLANRPDVVELRALLEEAEQRLAAGRLRFDERVRAYNERLERFPASWIAPLLELRPKAEFQPEESQPVTGTASEF